MTARRPPARVSTIRDLTADTKNARRHSARNLEAIATSLRKVGTGRSIVIDERNVVLAGNGTIKAAAEVGIDKVRVIDAQADEIIAVRRSGLSKQQKAELAVWDNRTAEMASWDAPALQALEAEGLDLSELFTDPELRAIGIEQPIGGGRTDPDAVPALRRTGIKPGQIFALGRHRLACGDATNPASVAALLHGVKPLLMVTDPPYGVKYDPAWRARAGINQSTKKLGAVPNDDRADWREAWALFPGDVAYVWHAALFAAVVQASLEACDFTARSQIVWRKDRFALSRGHYHWQHEPCWYAVRASATGHWHGDRKQSTVWDIPARDDAGGGHGTQKPVECMRRPIVNNSSPGQAVYEPFSGSGTTIVAAEQTGRSCLAMELDPVYVQQAIDRWEEFTGQKAAKLGEGA